MKLYIIALAFISILFSACNDSSLNQPIVQEQKYDMTGFAKGADVSWLTEMEKSDISFYNADGEEKECMTLLRDLGMNSIRLRVWVNPSDGWCDKDDLFIKAWRANQLGMRIMIDFHYSDSWADPSKQNKPAAWENLPFDSLKLAVASHTTEVLTMLKDNDITPEWVQVGNETGNGMLWDDGKASENMAQYAELTAAGYDAVKSVFPKTLVVVHLQNGYNQSRYKWIFDGLKNNGVQWDVIGMSLYPSISDEGWEELTTATIENMNALISRYSTPVMICETGMPWDDEDTAYAYLSHLITQCKAIDDDNCLGVFYWEPECYNGWKSYSMGAFDASGKPTAALDAFK